MLTRRIIFENSALLERAPAEAVKLAEIISNMLVTELNVDEMRNKRGADYNATKYYQIRLKPRQDTPLSEVLKSVEEYLKKQRNVAVNRVQINPRSFNSGKYSSVSFNAGGIDFDIVIAKGANQGEKFEKELLIKMDNLIAGIESAQDAVEAFLALQAADPSFKMQDVDTVVPRSGKTARSGDMTPEEIGKTIADIIIKMKNGDERYVSVKNRNGSTIAQFGVSKSFNDDLSVNTNTVEWKRWLAPFGLDAKLVEEGLKAAQSGIKQKWNDVVALNVPLNPTSQAYKVIEKMWGSNYFYLREKTGGKFKALHITPSFVKNTLLKNLRITQINYPSPTRKQITIFLENDVAKYRLEVRNPRGKGSVRPTQIQLSITRSSI